MNTKSILLSGAGLCILGSATILSIKENIGEHSPSTVPVLNSTNPSRGDHIEGWVLEQRSAVASTVSLRAALEEADTARRRVLLRQWADSLDVSAIRNFIAGIESATSPDLRVEIRLALLSSWSRRDVPGMADWFGTRDAADEMHQEARELLTQALVRHEPAMGFEWMEKSLPEAVRHELYGSFFRQWAGVDPAAAAAHLRHLSEASPGIPVWTDLIGQVVSQWAGADLKGAVAWTMTLPDGPDKSRVMMQLSDRWVQSDPNAAAAYAGAQHAPALLNAVVGKWAEIDPRNATAWANTLPVGAERSGALISAATTWTQKEPQAAATYVGGLSAEDEKARATLAVAAVWATADPAEAAKWVERFPEGTVREEAVAQLLGTWAERNLDAAGQWLRNLPDTRSRDVAVSAFCTVLESADPVASFAWAETISDKSIREQRIESAALAWMDRHPDAGAQN
jgi:hypothetical protein